MHTLLQEVEHEVGIARLLGGVVSDKRLWMLPDPAGRGAIHGHLAAGIGFARFARFEDVQTHGVGGRVVQNKSKKIELQNGVEALGKFVEETVQVVVLRDGFADFEKRLELPRGVLEAGSSRGVGRDLLFIVHERQNSTRFGEVTTGAGMNEKAENEQQWKGGDEILRRAEA